MSASGPSVSNGLPVLLWAALAPVLLYGGWSCIQLIRAGRITTGIAGLLALTGAVLFVPSLRHARAGHSRHRRWALAVATLSLILIVMGIVGLYGTWLWN